MWIHLRIIPAFRTERFYDNFLLSSAPYLNASAFLAQWPQAAIALGDGLSLIAYAAEF
jgi:hypothetical protein